MAIYTFSCSCDMLLFVEAVRSDSQADGDF